MSIYRIHRRDTTEPEIEQALFAAGARIVKIDSPCDLLVLFRGDLFMLEIKSKGGKLRPIQTMAIEAGWPITVCFDADDALKAIGAVK